MDAESFIYETLSNDAGVLAYTSSVTAMVIPEDAAGAAITFCRLSTVPLNSLCVNDSVSEFANMQIDFWGTQYRETIEMFYAARRALELAEKAVFTNRRDEKDAKTGYYRIISEFKIYI
jgi:hypothetical protein